MNKKNNKKGFTTVELVIVIAVIAILATVLIPTFSNLISKANNSAAMQEARNTYSEWLVTQDFSNGVPTDGTVYIEADGKYFTVTGGKFASNPVDPPATCTKVITTNDAGTIVTKYVGSKAGEETNCTVCGKSHS